MKICLVAANDIVYDSRVNRHAETLGTAGNHVTVLCMKSSRTSSQEYRPHYSVVRRRDFLRELIERRTRIKRRYCFVSHDVPDRLRISPARSVVRAFFRVALAIMFDLSMIPQARLLNADLYICNDLDTLRVGAFMKLLGKKLIYDSHELYPDLFGETRSYVRRLMKEIEAFLIGYADLVITVNGLIASEMSSRYHIPLPTVVMNCPKAILIPVVRTRQKDSRRVLYQGVLTRERGLENIVRACKYLRQGIQVVFRGDGPLKAKLRTLASGLENCVFEEPVAVDQVVSKAADADVGVVAYLPTTLNNLYASPNKLFEYLQAGLPIVGSDLPFIRKILIENNVGLVFDPHDPKDIARAINLITQDETHREMRKNADKIRNRFSWDSEAQKLLDAISAV